MLGKAQVTGQHPSTSSACLFICTFSYSWAIGPYATSDAFSVIGKTESQSYPMATDRERLRCPSDKGLAGPATKWKANLISGLVKMTLPFTRGIKWIVGSSINSSLKDALSRLAAWCQRRGAQMRIYNSLNDLQTCTSPSEQTRLGLRAKCMCIRWTST